MFMSAVALLALAAAVTAVPAAHARPQLILVVRQETTPPLPAETLRHIGAEVTRIWSRYVAIALQPADSLEPRRGDDTLRLVLTDRRTNGTTTAGLGWIDFVDGEPSQTITVSVSAARALGASGRWSGRVFTDWPPSLAQIFLVRAVGRAVAHEVGHYLLRSKAHTSHGLMRPVFTVAEIMENGVNQYLLQPAEVALLERRTTSPLSASSLSTRRRSEDPPLQ